MAFKMPQANDGGFTYADNGRGDSSGFKLNDGSEFRHTQ